MVIIAHPNPSTGRDLPVPRKNPVPSRLLPLNRGVDKRYDEDLRYLMDKVLKSLTEDVVSSHGVMTGDL